MFWLDILKRQPADESSFAFMLTDDRRVDALIEHLQDHKMTDSFAGRLGRFKVGKDNVATLFQKLGIPQEYVEGAEKNLERILEVANFSRVRNMEPLIDEALAFGSKIKAPNYEATREELQELSDMIKNIDDNFDMKEQKLRKKPQLEAKLRALNELDASWILKFKNIPEDSTEKQKFTENLETFAQFEIKRVSDGEKTNSISLGTAIGDQILTNFEDSNEFKATLSLKPKILEFFSENLVKYTPIYGANRKFTSKLSGGRGVDDILTQGTKFSSPDTFTAQQVASYIGALKRIKGNITKFFPTELKSGGVIPPAFILTRESVRSGKSGAKTLILNPYAKVLINNSFTDATWFENLFSALKTRTITTRNLAELLILDDIYNAVKNNTAIFEEGEPKSPKYKIPIGVFEDMELSDDGETARNTLKRTISRNADYSRQFSSAVTGLQNNTLSGLENFLTPKEAREFENIWNENNEELGLDTMGELEIVMRDSDGNTIGADGDERIASFAEVKIGGDTTPPKELKELLDDFDLEGGKQIEIFDKLRDAFSVSSQDTPAFVQYLLDKNAEELNQLTKTGDSDLATTLDSLNPDNSMKVLSQFSTRIRGEYRNLVRDALLKMSKTKDMQERLNIAMELESKMRAFLEVLQEEMRGSFARKLGEFARNYGGAWGKTKGINMDAITQFSSAGLLRVGG